MASATHHVRALHAESRRAMAVWASAHRWLAQLAFLLGYLAAPGVAWAVDMRLPSIDPAFTIEVTSEAVAKEQRGGYDILAFTGECRLKQGDLTASANEMILWIERSGPPGAERPGKIICLFDGAVVMQWGESQQLHDQRWMGRLFSLYPVHYESQREIQRYDIPSLDWARDPASKVQLAQFSQPSDIGGGLLAPPLLQATPSQQNANVEQLPTPSQIPVTPGAVEWPSKTGSASDRSGSTQNSELLPSGGLVIPGDGRQPYPAGGSLNLNAPQVQPQPPAFPEQAPQVAYQIPADSPFAAKSVQFVQRTSNTKITYSPDPVTGESIVQIRGGFKLVVNGVQVTQSDGTVEEFGSVSLEADNAVVWLHSAAGADVFQGLTSTPERPIELYLDGNIVFYQGNRVIYADRMYYNVSSEYGMVISAEVLTPVPQYEGLLRLKADVLQQINRQNFQAFGAAVTSSRLGVPRYWMQADEVTFSDNRTEQDLSVFAPTDTPRETNMRATSNNNFVYLGGFPVFYWPTFNTDLSRPSYYVTGVKFKNDTIFGTQVFTEFDAFQLLGINGPEGTDLRLSADYLSDRGVAGGIRFDYDRPTWFFGAPGIGYSDAWFIRDQGQDFLGIGRQGLTPEEETRGRLWSRHRLFLTPNTEIMAESGWISDRNFLEQYFEQEWDQQKDFSTAARIRRYNGNRMFDVFGQARVNEFFTETEWLPRIDHYWLGQDLFSQRLTWSAKTSVGYAHQKVASTPTDPQDAAAFGLLPWESDSEGLRAITRQELSMPFSLGAWDVVPFLSGEAGFWNEDINQDDQTRLTGQAGIRTSLPMWRVYPNVENRLFDLRGIAHKMTWQSEFFYADSNKDPNLFPLYDPLDDNSQEHFRRRFIFNTFGGTLPQQFDERGYAVRSGMQRWVTAGSSEMVDDLMQVRLGLNQRWQTKRGLPGRERIVDLVEFDVDLILYPKADRDNVGEEVGAVNYDFRYHVGDRLTLLSDGYMDVFSQGLKTFSAGAQMSRPGRGDAYLGFLSIEGPVSANIVNGYVNYRMNEKWIFSSGAAFDFGATGNIGQSFGLTRIGETALIRLGLNVDHGRDNVAFNFNIEPRFLSTSRLGSLGGELIPAAGLFGLE